MTKTRTVGFIEYGPKKDQIIERDKKRICLSVRFNKKGNKEFFCNNKCYPYEFIFPPMIAPIKIWISQTMICENCLKNLEKKYFIDFKKMIPKTFFEKGWQQSDFINYKNYKMIVSLNNYFSNINKNEIETDPEKYWWNQFYCLIGLPIRWLKNFNLIKSSEKGSKNQGKLNGPDFIFLDNSTNKKIGLEIISYKWNLFTTFSKKDSLMSYAKKKIFNCYNDKEEIEELKKIILNKSQKKYEKCDELFLGIVIKDTLMDYEYYVFELILNKYIKNEKIELSGVYIL